MAGKDGELRKERRWTTENTQSKWVSPNSPKRTYSFNGRKKLVHRDRRIAGGQ